MWGSRAKGDLVEVVEMCERICFFGDNNKRIGIVELLENWQT